MFEGIFTVTVIRLMGSEQQHVRYQLRATDGSGVEAVDFGGGDRAAAPGTTVELAYQLGVNRYNGSEGLQLRVVHLNVVQLNQSGARKATGEGLASA